MPQLVKGGKYVFGWCEINENGEILIPEEAWQEYRYVPGERVFLISGSRTSGGFGIVRKPTIEQSKLSDILVSNPDLADFRIEEGEVIVINGRAFCWATVNDDNALQLSGSALKSYSVSPGECLLAVRGSNIGMGLAVKGPLVAEAKKHPELRVFKV